MIAPTRTKPRSALRGVLAGLLPLGMFIGVFAVALVVADLARPIIGAPHFFTQQAVALIIIGLGFITAIVAFGITLARTMQRIAGWQNDGDIASARIALWELGISALFFLLIVILAVVAPQHPAV
jgi:hypothetical protein